MRSIEELLEDARESLEANRPQIAIERAEAARARLAPKDERHKHALEILVDAFEARDDLPRAIAAQLESIALGIEASARDRGVDYERLGDLYHRQIERSEDEFGIISGAPRPLRRADEAYRTAHAWYVEAAGPATADAIDALGGRLRVAYDARRLEDVHHLAMEIAQVGRQVADGARVRKRVATVLESLSGFTIDLGMRKPTAALAEAEALLGGRPNVSREVQPHTGPPRLALVHRWSPSIVSGRVGLQPIEIQLDLKSAGGPLKGIEIACRGAAIAQGLLGPPTLTLKFDRGGRSRSRTARSVLEGEEFIARAPIELGPTVVNEAELERIGGFGLSEAQARTRCSVHLTAEVLERGRSEFEIELRPHAAPGTGVTCPVRVTLTRPRTRAKKKTTRTSAPNPPPTTGPIRRRRSKPRVKSDPPWTRRGAAILRCFDAAESDADMRLDLNRHLTALEPAAQHYVLLVAQDRPLPDETAATTLGIDPERLAAVLQDVDAFVRALDEDPTAST